jgi:acyl dehydratase
MAIITRDTPVGYEANGKLKTITLERVNAFSGGYPKSADWPKKNIHTDLEFAKSCGLPTRAVSGATFEGYLTELMIYLFGEGFLSGGRMKLAFIKIVDVGDSLLPKAVVQSKQPAGSKTEFTIEVWCQNQHGQKVVVGTATAAVI